jgi:hypothetical protein
LYAASLLMLSAILPVLDRSIVIFWNILRSFVGVDLSSGKRLLHFVELIWFLRELVAISLHEQYLIDPINGLVVKCWCAWY